MLMPALDLVFYDFFCLFLASGFDLALTPFFLL
jgi:hypothetical protein